VSAPVAPPAVAPAPGRPGLGRLRRWRHRDDALAIGGLLLVTVAYLAPAFKDGAAFAPADLGRGLSFLTSLAHAAPNHDVVNGDIITQSLPWHLLDWRLVHRGELPLWNGLAGTGMPQLLNFESAALALPTLVSYLFPQSLSFLVAVAATLFLAGCGAYVCCRVLGARPGPAALGGVTFMLSGFFSGRLGWSITGPFAFTGFLAAFLLLAYRRPGLRHVVGLAASVAFAVYGGFPEAYPLIAIGLAAFLGVGGLAALAQGRLELAGIGRALAGSLAGLALAAPLWLGGLPLLRASTRSGAHLSAGLPLSALALVVTQGYDGLPLGTPAHPQGTYFGPLNYFETAAYVGVVALFLAAVALLAAWRRPAVLGAAAGALASALVAYQLGSHAPVQRLLADVGLGAVAVQRMLVLLAFFLAVLAALGAEALWARAGERRLRVASGLALALAVLAVAALWAKSGGSLPPADAAVRRRSLAWPSASLLVVAAVALAARAGPRRALGRQVRAALAALTGGAQVAFLLVAGVGINSYARDPFPVTPAVAALARRVGTGLVALDGGNVACPSPAGACGVRQWTDTGLYPEMNVAYGIDELAVHDPLIPKAYFDAWPVPDAGQDAGGTNLFAPAVTSAALARRYGAAYVLAGPHRPAPAGTRLVAAIPTHAGRLRLYAVPGASRFSLEAGGRDLPASGRSAGDAAYQVALPASSGGTLVARITAVPGWHASAGGRPLAVRAVDGLLAVEVPPGTRSVTLRYFPALLGVGFLLALVALVALVLAGVLGRFVAPGRRRRGSLVASAGG